MGFQVITAASNVSTLGFQNCCCVPQVKIAVGEAGPISRYGLTRRSWDGPFFLYLLNVLASFDKIRQCTS